MAKINFEDAVIKIVKKYLVSFGKSLASKFYTKKQVDTMILPIPAIQTDVDNLKARSVIGSELDYLYCKLSADVSYTAGQNIPFVQSGDAKGLSINNGIITLKAGKTYAITLGLYDTIGAWKFIYNLTDNKEIGNRSDYIRVTESFAIFKCVKDTQITARVDRTTSTCSSAGSFFQVIEMARTEIIDPAQQIDKESGIQDTPLGHIMPFVGINAPTHYLICDGSIYNITDKRDLANYFLTEFGSINYFGGDGVTTFAVPDLRGKTPVGLNALDSDFTKINNVGGEKTHQLTVSEMPKHSHDGKASIHDVDSALSQGYPKSNYHNSFRTSDRAQTYSMNVGAISTTGENTYHNNMQPYIVVNFAIKFEKTYFMNYSPQYAGFDTKTLFEGTANSAGDYILSDDVNNYQFLYVYGDISNGFDKSMSVIDVSAISPTETLSYFQYVNGYYNIRFTIYGKNLTYIDSTIGSAWDSYNPRISKIVGVKSGSMNVEAFNITDAEADNGVADIWNEVEM